MSEVIHQYREQVQDSNGMRYDVRVLGTERDDATWEGWIEFRPIGGAGRALHTERETSQPNRAALLYWASGLEPVYLEGALARAR